MGKSSKRTLEADAAPSSDAAPAAEVEAMEVDEPKAKKSKKGGDDEAKEIPKEALSAIAKPLAGKKTGKKVLKLVKKGQSRSRSRARKRWVQSWGLALEACTG